MLLAQMRIEEIRQQRKDFKVELKNYLNEKKTLFVYFRRFP